MLVGDQGDYPAARKYYEDALAVKRKVLGNEHTSTAGTLNNLGNSGPRSRRLYDSPQVLRDALAIHRKVFSNEHISTARSLNSLGTLVVRSR